jgi:AraC family transcriptional activator of tynA and feaB
LGIEGRTVRIETVSTLDVPRSGRAPSTARHAHAPSSSVKHRIYDDPSVDGTLEIADIAWLQVARVTASRHRVVHQPPAAHTPAAAVVLQITGKSVIEQQGRTVRLAPGHWSVCDSTLPYILTSPGASQRHLLLIPHDCLDDDTDLEDLTTRSFSGTAGVGRLVFGIAGWIVEELSSIHAERADVLAKTITQIINLAIHEKMGRRNTEPERGTLGERIRAYVTDHLRDPHLSLDSIAKHLNSSKRSLHRAVSTSSSSIHDLIWHQRLDRCRRDLLDPSQSRQTIAEIAHSWGFKNFTHFSQAFRERFGISAREARRSILSLND